ncbi:MAG: pantoate--beta-alanine ligase [Bdellovibrionales bacterium]|nr:pantoate--beta-alanine ligase [Bdellovibrionales bacterium]
MTLTTDPVVCRRKEEVRRYLGERRRQGQRIGVVPTMGALHEGHVALARALRQHCDFLAMWIFVNPTQFNDPVDYERYPRTLQRDCKVAGEAGVELIFAPEVEEIYPAGLDAYRPGLSVRVRAGDRSLRYEGEHRPGHFDGVIHVCTVMFNILQPDVVAFGEKDFQQVSVIRQLLVDLSLPIELITVPIVRGEGGLALSSRNKLLHDEGPATAIWHSLQHACARAEGGETSVQTLATEVSQRLLAAGLRPEYVAIVDPDTLQPLERLAGEARLLVAAFADNNVRLIDNIAIRGRVIEA